MSAGTAALSQGTMKAVICDRVFTAIEHETGATRVNLDTALDSLNLDSLEFMDLLLEIGDSVGREVPDSAIGNLKTVGDIVEALC